MVLKEIIVKDMILNFSLVFIFTVVAFSCALHALRMLIASHQDVFTRTTVYDIFMSALGVGDFIERVTEDSEEIESSMGLMFAVYALYVCFTLIILMNILIAMLSNRYAIHIQWRTQRGEAENRAPHSPSRNPSDIT